MPTRTGYMPFGISTSRAFTIPLADWPVSYHEMPKVRKPEKNRKEVLDGQAGQMLDSQADREIGVPSKRLVCRNALRGVPRPGTPISRLAKLRNANLPIGCLTLRTPRRAFATDRSPQD